MELFEYVLLAEEGGQTGHGHMIHTPKKFSTYLLWEDVQGKLSGRLSVFVAGAYKICISFNSAD